MRTVRGASRTVNPIQRNKRNIRNIYRSHAPVT
jgi:hypothetical protein